MMKGGSFTSSMIKLKKEQDRIKKRQESGNFELCLNDKLIYECYEPRLRFREQLIPSVSNQLIKMFFQHILEYDVNLGNI